jgi:hypothetical protein
MLNMNKTAKLYMKRLIITLIIIVNLIIIAYIHLLHFDESSSLGLINILPIIFFGNILLGIFFRLIKSDAYYLFYINSILSCLIAFVTMYISINYYKNENMKNKIFILGGITYYVNFYNVENSFELTNSNSNRIINGRFYKTKNEKVYLNSINFKEKVYIYRDTIYNYPLKNTKVAIEK